MQIVFRSWSMQGLRKARFLDVGNRHWLSYSGGTKVVPSTVAQDYPRKQYLNSQIKDFFILNLSISFEPINYTTILGDEHP